MNVDKRGRGTLPEEVRRDLGIGEEDSSILILERTERGTYELVPASLVPKSQLWFRHPQMQQRIAQAEADFREGRSSRAQTPEDAQSLLEGMKRG